MEVICARANLPINRQMILTIGRTAGVEFKWGKIHRYTRPRQPQVKRPALLRILALAPVPAGAQNW